MRYTAPTESTIFLLRDVLGFENENTEAILTEAAKLCEEVIAPTNQKGDKQGCFRHFQIGPDEKTDTVQVPTCFYEPWQKFTEGGWLGLSVPEQYGGQGLPYALASSVNEFVSSSNMAFSLCPGLTRGAIQALLKVATEEQKQFFIPRMASGEWTGTMNLTEPHCGTDLGLIKTKAVPQDDNDYSHKFYITGQKIFISCGEHDLADNIIHLVLARIEGDPEGTKGISLFIVPKMFSGIRNKVTCGSIEEKMGIHGSPTCVMNYDGATGFLVGERGKGLNAMFVMMNEARLGVAIQGLSQSELAYQNALEYAKERHQGTVLNPTGLDKNVVRSPCSIIHHPDVRRMLMDIRCINEAARLLVLEAAMLCDDESQDAQDRLGLLTPVLKGVLTDYGFENAVKAQQVFGGHGYIREWGMEQIVRDARIAQIYEGTNGVQALDLVGRKLPKDMGRAIRKFMDDSKEFINGVYGEAEINIIVQPVTAALNDLRLATEWLVGNAMANPNNAGSASYDYMKMFGLVLLGMAHVRIVSKSDDKDRRDNALYFMERIISETRFLLERIRNGSGVMMGAEF
jgi:alkylation response protein AidB-like acyl-CoA dehydrogenase